MRQLEASHQQRKSDGKYAEEFPLIFMGCDVVRVEMLFTNFIVEHNIALSAANHARHLAHVSGKLNWRTIYTTLRIKLLHLKSDFATLKSPEGLAALPAVRRPAP